MSSGLPYVYEPRPVDDPKKDIAKESRYIKQAEKAIAELQQTKVDVASLINSPRGGTKLGSVICDSSGCVRTFSTDKFGGPGVTIKVRVDAKGFLLPGEFDKEVSAETKAIDIAINQNIQLMINAKTQMDFDYASLPLPGNGGADLHKNGTIHQQ